MKKISNKIKLSAIAAVLGVNLVALPAQAGVLATAMIDLTNFQFTNTVTNTVITQGTEVNILSGNNFGTLTADLFSVPGGLLANQTSPILAGGAFDGAPQTEGAPGRVNNDFSVVPLPVIRTGSYAHSDNLLENAAVAGLGVPVGVHAGTIAEVMLITEDQGISSSTTGTNTSFEFVANADLTIAVDFDYIAQALTFVDPATSVSPSNATAGISFSINLTDDTAGGVLVNNFAPTDLNQSSGRTDATPGEENVQSAGHFTGTFDLIAGNTYQLSINQQVQVNAQKTLAVPVPEPGTLALLGLGLLGLMASPIARRRG